MSEHHAGTCSCIDAFYSNESTAIHRSCPFRNYAISPLRSASLATVPPALQYVIVFPDRCIEPEFARAVLYLHDTNVIIAALEETPYIVLSRDWFWHSVSYLLPHWRASRHLPSLPFPEGVFSHQHKASVWPVSEYPERVLPTLLQILRETGLLLPYGPQSDTSLVPSLLEPASLRNSIEPSRPACQRMCVACFFLFVPSEFCVRCRYDFAAKIPPSLVVQLISRASSEYTLGALSRSGFVILHDTNRLRFDVQAKRYSLCVFRCALID